MRSRCVIQAMIAGLIFLVTNVFGGTIPSGYEKVAWNTELSMIQKRYPRGQVAKLGDEVVYKQRRPNKAIARRNFAFREGKLHAVSVAFEKGHVEKMGIGQLIDIYTGTFGVGNIDRSQAPHMINVRWVGNGSRITFAYAPKFPDMTVIMYEREESDSGTVSR